MIYTDKSNYDSRCNPLLLDTTLRDGEQSPGLYFTHDEKIELALNLDSLGVDIIEVGTPSMGIEEQTVFESLKKQNLNAKILAWNRLIESDLYASLNADIENLHFSVPTSAIHLNSKIKKDESWILHQMDKIITIALKEGCTVSLGAEDSSRSDVDFLISIFQYAEALGVTRIRYADTLGILTPEKTAKIISKITSNISIPIDFHAHNDFGLATANSLAAWKHGADVISCSLLGYGERAGNTALEEFVGMMHFLENRFEEFNLIKLKSICEKLSQFSSRPISPYKPLFGRDVFTHESGIHVDGLIKASQNYQFFPPENVGGKQYFIVGKHSGKSALRTIAQTYSHTIDDNQADQFIQNLHRKMANQKNINSTTLFLDFLKEVVHNDCSESENER